MVKYVKKVKELIDKPLNELELEDVRAIRKKVKFPRKLDISVFYQLTGRLPHEGIEFKEEDFIIHFYHSYSVGNPFSSLLINDVTPLFLLRLVKKTNVKDLF